jgi:hypothetical protein
MTHPNIRLIMSRITLPALILLTVNSCFATLYTFTPSPSLPTIGSTLDFKVFSVFLNTPSPTPGAYTLTIKTNYGGDSGVVMPVPGQPDLIPQFPYGGQMFGMSDFLVTWNGRDYGLVLSPHDGYGVGLYELCFSCSFETSVQVMGLGLTPRPNYDVYIAPGFTGSVPNSTLVGAVSSLVVTKTGDGVSSAMYTIVETFDAPTGFMLDPSFTIQYSSYVCANSYVSGGPQPDVQVPEPGTMLLTGGVLIWLGKRRLHCREKV